MATCWSVRGVQALTSVLRESMENTPTDPVIHSTSEADVPLILFVSALSLFRVRPKKACLAGAWGPHNNCRPDAPSGPDAVFARETARSSPPFK